ncbi:hypothetical protein Scep_008184 [Stephania cephalantha]|uniref:Uncharacterized protein n=1 Tax=Stephania cephalantha TaxID=152367 RepID=A0AAP0KBI0_9MAGN
MIRRRLKENLNRGRRKEIEGRTPLLLTTTESFLFIPMSSKCHIERASVPVLASLMDDCINQPKLLFLLLHILLRL